MKALVVYESMFGNSAAVAKAVARGMGDVAVVEVGETTAAQFADADLLVLGGPTHAFSMTRPSTRRDAHTQGAPFGDDHRGIRELLDELPATFTVPVATFDTRVSKVRKLPGSAAKAATKELRHHHHAKVVAQESFFVDDTAGPLLDGELDRAEAWGAALTHTISAN
jgi:flavodoxin